MYSHIEKIYTGDRNIKDVVGSFVIVALRVVISRTLISHKLSVKDLGFVPGQSFNITEYQLMKKINEIKSHYPVSTNRRLLRKKKGV
jgi:hypothetical protein